MRVSNYPESTTPYILRRDPYSSFEGPRFTSPMLLKILHRGGEPNTDNNAIPSHCVISVKNPNISLSTISDKLHRSRPIADDRLQPQ